MITSFNPTKVPLLSTNYTIETQKNYAINSIIDKFGYDFDLAIRDYIDGYEVYKLDNLYKTVKVYIDCISQYINYDIFKAYHNEHQGVYLNWTLEECIDNINSSIFAIVNHPANYEIDFVDLIHYFHTFIKKFVEYRGTFETKKFQNINDISLT